MKAAQFAHRQSHLSWASNTRIAASFSQSVLSLAPPEFLSVAAHKSSFVLPCRSRPLASGHTSTLEETGANKGSRFSGTWRQLFTPTQVLLEQGSQWCPIKHKEKPMSYKTFILHSPCCRQEHHPRSQQELPSPITQDPLTSQAFMHTCKQELPRAVSKPAGMPAQLEWDWWQHCWGSAFSTACSVAGTSLQAGSSWSNLPGCRENNFLRCQATELFRSVRASSFAPSLWRTQSVSAQS